MKILSLIAIFLLLKGPFALAQEASRNNYTGSWTTNASWQDNSAPGFTNISQNFSINGYITLGSPSPAPASNMTFRNNPDQAGLAFTVNDTLVVHGNITMDNNSMDLRIGPGALLIVFGNVTLGNNMDVNSTGNIIVTGSFTKSGSAGQGSYTGGGNIYSPNISVPGNWVPPADQKDIANDLQADLGDVFDFVTGGGNQPLPVELASFKVTSSEDFITLNWSTASQLNFSHFEVEHSINATEWSVLTEIQGEGTTNDLMTYTYTHSLPHNGKNYYRLRMVDLDATFEYSHIESVQVNARNTFSVSPNPSKGGVVKYELNFTPSEGDRLFVYDLMGGFVLSDTVSLMEQAFVLPNSLAKGTYLVRYKGQNVNQVVRLIVE